MVGFLFPPHPYSSMKIRPESVDKLDKEGGWIAQRKYNGWHCVIHLHHGESRIWNRNGELFQKYELTENMKQALSKIVNPNIEIVLDGELLHGQAKSDITGIQSQMNTIALFDILYYNNPLLMMGFEERYNLLNKICGEPKQLESKRRGLIVSEHNDSQIWLAEIFKDDFLYRFYEMYEFDEQGRDKFPDIEGLVCKRTKNSMLKSGNNKYDVNWMMRVRKTKEKVYLF